MGALKAYATYYVITDIMDAVPTRKKSNKSNNITHSLNKGAYHQLPNKHAYWRVCVCVCACGNNH